MAPGIVIVAFLLTVTGIGLPPLGGQTGSEQNDSERKALAALQEFKPSVKVDETKPGKHVVGIGYHRPTLNNWPAWRGPEGNGHCKEKNLPVKWSATQNVQW